MQLSVSVFVSFLFVSNTNSQIQLYTSYNTNILYTQIQKIKCTVQNLISFSCVYKYVYVTYVDVMSCVLCVVHILRLGPHTEILGICISIDGCRCVAGIFDYYYS